MDVQLGGLGATAALPRGAQDVATALRLASAAMGHRPAVTVIGPGYRHEQGFASLAGWAAKGAHLLRDELGLGPGDALGVDAPPSWPLAAVAVAAWWVGVALGPVVPGRPAVVHEGRPDPGGPVLWLGDGIDGGPAGPDLPGVEAWTAAVTPFPDRPPAPGAAPDATAVVGPDGRILTQRDLLDAWSDEDGALGLRRTGSVPRAAGADPSGIGAARGEVGEVDELDALGALAVRPLVTGRPTVVVAGAWDPDALRAALASERVARWA